MANPLLDLLQQRDAYHQTAKGILDRAETEGRKLTPDELKDVQGLREKIERSNTEVRQREYFKAGAGADFAQPSESSRAFLDSAGMGGAGTAAPARGNVFANMGEQLDAIRRAGTPGGDTDPRLFTVRAASGASESVGPDGGFLLEPTFSNQIWQRSYTNGALASRCYKIPLGANSNTLKLPYLDETSRATGSRLGGIRIYRMNEADAVTGSKPKLAYLEVRAEKLGGLFYVTDEMLADSTALGAFAQKAFPEEIAFTLDDEILNGDGVGKCLGILKSGALVTVSKEAGQTADTVVLANVTKMYSRMWARSKQNAVWFINTDITPQLFGMTIVVGGVTYPVYLPPGGASASPYATLFGRPVIEIEQAGTLGDLGDIIFADLSQYLLTDKPPETAFSMHVRFAYDEGCFRFTYRVNGQPIWKKPLTPFKGSNTLSPFVALEART